MKKVENQFGVLIALQSGFRFVTSTENHAARWEEGKTAELFSKSRAEDIAQGLCFNGYPAMVVTIPEYITYLKNE